MTVDWGSVCCSIMSGGNALTACYKRVQGVFPGHLYTFEVEVETEEMTSTELVFEFEIQFDYILSESSEAWEIKKMRDASTLGGPFMLMYIIESFKDRLKS